jgi:hypothetical protein
LILGLFRSFKQGSIVPITKNEIIGIINDPADQFVNKITYKFQISISHMLIITDIVFCFFLVIIFVQNCEQVNVTSSVEGWIVGYNNLGVVHKG